MSRDATSFSVTRDIEYAVHDGVSLKAHLWRPAGSAPAPVLIAIHGGGWQMGGPDNYRQWGPWLATRGMALFAIGYRFSTATQKMYPQAVHDARAAVQYMKGRAIELGLDAQRIALMGDSAGAHLSALVALAGDRPVFANAYADDPYASLSTKVRAVIGNYGVYDMVQQWHHDQAVRASDHIVQKFLGCAPMDDRHIYFESSPLSYAVRGAADTSFLLVHGDEDDVVDRVQTDVFHDALKMANVFSRKLIVPGAGHYFTQYPFDEPDSHSAWLAPRVLRFLQERMA
jgi:acetyl esterase/lipase